MEVEGATERLVGATMEGESNMDQKPLKKFTITDNATAAAPNSGSFDCNICLDLAADPIVTLCGHLYCWPCIYRWLQQGDGASPQQCPVCKAALLHQSLVPLYGHGQSSKAATSQQILDVPRRPSFDQREAIEQGLLELNEDQNRAAQPLHLAEHHVLDHPFDSSVGDDFRGTRMMHPTSGEVLGGIAVAVLPWVFRNQESGRVHHSSPYHLVGSGGGSPRQEMELRRSLHQIWVFLSCCAVLFLLLF